ncbi:MAG TPA: hypothetical protein PLB10_18665 [Thiolinea sp.]|nr:hypothetical protein [Thiolinea sp.]
MAANAPGRPARPRRTIKLTLVLIILLSVISFFTSYKGLLILNTENDQSLTAFQIGFTAFMVFTIQTTMVVTLLFSIQGYRILTRVLALFVYLVAMLFSVFFSYGWWYEVFRAESYAQEVYKDGIESIRRDASTYAYAFAHVREVSGELSKYSSARAREENLYGGTCDEKSVPGRGALNYLRDQEASLFGNMAEDMDALEQRVNTHITDLNKLLDNLDLSQEGAVARRERELNDIVNQIGNYKTGSGVTRLRTELEAHKGDKRRFLESVNPKTEEKTVVSCTDAEITRKIDALLVALDDLPEPRTVTLFDQNNNRTVLQRAWEVLSSLLTLEGLRHPGEQLARLNLNSTDYIPLVAGGLIDLFILILGFIDGLEYGRRYTGRRYSEADARELALFQHQDGSRNDQLRLLQPYLYQGWSSYYLIVPAAQAVQSDTERQLLRLMAWLEAHQKVKSFAAGVPFERLPAVMQEFFTMDTELNHWRQLWHFDIYRINPKTWRELVISHARLPQEGEA